MYGRTRPPSRLSNRGSEKKAGRSGARPRASSAAVRKRMLATPSRDTPIELSLRSCLHRLGLRFRLHRRLIPGMRRTADIALIGARVAVFVDGCFWHGCPRHGTLPKKTNRRWWALKIEANRQRDRDTNNRLRQLGWTTVRVWEHENPFVAAARVAALSEKRSGGRGLTLRQYATGKKSSGLGNKR